MGEFLIFIMVSLLGFFGGGLIGEIQTKGFYPACWWGLLLVILLYAIVQLKLFTGIADMLD